MFTRARRIGKSKANTSRAHMKTKRYCPYVFALTDLPLELMMLVSKFLGEDDYLNFARSCKHIYEFLGNIRTRISWLFFPYQETNLVLIPVGFQFQFNYVSDENVPLDQPPIDYHSTLSYGIDDILLKSHQISEFITNSVNKSKTLNFELFLRCKFIREFNITIKSEAKVLSKTCSNGTERYWIDNHTYFTDTYHMGNTSIRFAFNICIWSHKKTHYLEICSNALMMLEPLACT
jgi:hypothetical protein